MCIDLLQLNSVSLVANCILNLVLKLVKEYAECLIYCIVFRLGIGNR